MTDQQSPERYQRFLRLFTSHEPAIRAFVRKLVPSRTDADDVLQEVAIVLWERFDDFQPEGSFRSWAYGIARLKALSRLRDMSRNRHVLASDVIELIAEKSEETDGQLEKERELLDQCFKKVPAKDQELLAMAYQPHVEIQDVAAMSGRSVRGFYQWLYRMRSMLSECIRRQLAKEVVQ
ncbi:sigma-70 family RNA polymerase sigma factor [bacterium]|nr:sigma-70 family RNA polymerase sigma factor [bacterium]